MSTHQKEEWNKRYNANEYVYGTQPNVFFAEFLINSPITGKLLLPAEGEGRNAVFAASRGWETDAFDFSEMAKEKALMLANKNNVSINYSVKNYENIVLPEKHYDLIALIYSHMPDDILKIMATKYYNTLKNGGSLIMEAFSKEQIRNTSGGPKLINMLYDTTSLKEAFIMFNIIKLERKQIVLNEGSLHKGESEVIRMIAKKEV